MTYRALESEEPKYVWEKLNCYSNNLGVGTRWGSNFGRLEEPGCRLELGTCRFSYVASQFYNKLPVAVRQSNSLESFKKNLKTHLFSVCYDHEDKVIADDFKL